MARRDSRLGRWAPRSMELSWLTLTPEDSESSFKVQARSVRARRMWRPRSWRRRAWGGRAKPEGAAGRGGGRGRPGAGEGVGGEGETARLEGRGIAASGGEPGAGT